MSTNERRRLLAAIGSKIARLSTLGVETRRIVETSTNQSEALVDYLPFVAPTPRKGRLIGWIRGNHRFRQQRPQAQGAASAPGA